jgi:hypothetical protein
MDCEAMKTDPPNFHKDSKLTIAQRLSELSVLEDVDDMLRDGISCGDVAKFIQLGLEELTDVNPPTLAKVLGQRRKAIMDVQPQPVLDPRLAAIIPVEARRPAQLARNQYVVQHKMMDRLIELEALYLAQRDRLDAIITKEIELGFPFEMTDRSMMAAAKLLELHGKQERELLDRIGDGPAHEKLDLKGYSEETAQTLRKADSRRRVVSIVERLKRVKGGVEIPELPGAERAEASGE